MQQKNESPVAVFFNRMIDTLKSNKAHLDTDTLFRLVKIKDEVLEYEKNEMKEELIGFQIFLNNSGLITNYDWDYDKEAAKYLHKVKENAKK